MKFYITGTRRGLGKELAEILPTVDNLEDCDIFINNKHDGYSQVDMLYKATELKKRVISLGSNSSDKNVPFTHYSIQKKALRSANEQLYNMGHNVTCLNFGYFDTERVAHKNVPKMDLDYVVEVVLWVIKQEYRVKEITVAV